jgi:hypothetical protein
MPREREPERERERELYSEHNGYFVLSELKKILKYHQDL